MDLEPGQVVSRYRLVEKLGEGGMGVVWKAQDTELNRHVAIKLLPPDLAGDEERRLRFRREAQAAAALNHSNIAVIYEVGEHQGSPFIAMEHLAGRTLRARLKAGPMETLQWLELALSIAEALAHAHKNGVIHRDLKPDNVMITSEGQVKLLDFGLAKVMQPEAASPPAGEDLESRLETISRELTRAGKVFGTVAYMSPEQAKGHPVDHRSDLFSLGIMIYEMAGGRLPFKAGSDVETLSAVIAAEPQALSEFTPDVPAEAERIARKALEKSPEDRYQNAADLAADLRVLRRDLQSGKVSRPAGSVISGPAVRPRRSSGMRAAVIGAISIGLLAATAALWSRFHPAPADPAAAAPARIQSIAVLPFEAGGGGEDLAYLGDGITESVINKLSKVSSLRVVPRQVVFSYESTGSDLARTGKDLDVQAVVTGRVAQRGDQLVISAELIDVATVSQLWGERYARTRQDIFAVQEEITRRIAGALEIELSPEDERSLANRPTENAEAYEAYLQGQALAITYEEEAMRAARTHFLRALEIDPDYALAMAGLATVETMLYRNVGGSESQLDRAQAYTEQALAIDPGLARAIAAQAEIYGARYDYAKAAEKFREAIRLDPDEPSYHDNLSWALAYVIPPDGPGAEAAAREAIRLSPRFGSAYYHLGRALLAQGRIDEAIEAFRFAEKLEPESSMGPYGLGQAYLLQGEFEQALKQFFSQAGAVTPLVRSGVAAAYAGLGRTDEALNELEQAVAGGFHDPTFLETSHLYDPLREDPRFIALLEELK